MDMIPVFTLSRQNKNLENQLQQAIKEVIDGGVFILGPKVAEFEKKFADYLGVNYAVGVASGTDALSLGLLALGVKTGDEVILPANCYPSVFAVSAIGAIPRLVDIDPLTFNIDPSKIDKALSKKTKAIVAVHLYGQPADMREILGIGEKYNIPVIEDCAQAHGAEITISSKFNPAAAGQSSKLQKNNEMERLESGGRRVGSIGDIGCFSFYPTKNLGCFGDGGMVVTDNAEIASKVRLLRMYGEEARYKSIILGRNSRLDELQAAILLVKLKYLDRWNERRREIAKLYSKYLQEFTGPAARVSHTTIHLRFGRPSLASPVVKFQGNIKHVYHLFVIRAKERDKLKNYLEKKGIGTAIHYPKPIHLQQSYKYLGYKKGDFPESEKACREVLSLPMFPELKDDEIERVCWEVKRFYKESLKLLK